MSTRAAGLALLILAFGASGACSRTDVPTSPGDVAGASVGGAGGAGGTSATASISGSLFSPGGGAMPGVAVAVPGTNAKTQSDGAGKFALSNVPAGDVQLQFTAPGTNATLPITAIQPTEAIDVTISLSGSSAVITASNRPGNQGNGVDFPVNGIVSAFSGTPSAFQFEVDTYLIKGDASTAFFGNSAFSELANGVRVEVKGTRNTGFVYANRIHINISEEPEPTPDLPASIEGVLLSKSGTAPLLTLMVDSTVVKTDGGTIVRRRGDVQPLTVLATGMTVHVEGVRQSDGSLLARMIQIKDDAPGGVFEIEGSLGGLRGTCPAISFNVNGFKISTDGSTTFTSVCSTLKSGNKVKVTGTSQADGSVKATAVEKL